MRLTVCRMAISSFKKASSKKHSLLMNDLRQQNSSSFRRKFSCACQRYNSESEYISAVLGPNFLKKLNAGLDTTRYTQRQFSVNIPPVQDSETVTINENGPKTRNRTLDQVVYHLQADIRRRRRIHKADIHNAIELTEEASKVENFGTFLLNCCCDILPDLHPTYRVKLAERIWTVIQNGKEYSSAHFEAMLKALALNEDKILNPFSFLEEAKNVGVEPTGTMYFFALLIVCQRGDLEAAVDILNTMKKNSIPVNERYFNALMIGNLRSGDLESATELLKIMRASQIDATIHTWNTLLHIYLEAGKIEELQKTYSEITGSQLTEDQFYELLKAAGRQTNSKIMDLVINWALESQKMHMLSVVNLILQLMYLGHPQSSLKLLLKFEYILRTRQEPLGAFFIKELISVAHDEETYLRIITSLQGENKNPYALNMAAESCLKNKKFDLAYKLFESMPIHNVPLRPHYFLPAFLAETEKNGTLGGLNVLKQMDKLTVKLDWEMLLSWVLPTIFNEERNLLESLKIIKDATGLSYSSDGLLSAGLILALKEKKLEEGIAVVEKIKAKILYPDVLMQTLFLYICDMEEKDKRDLNSVAKIISYISKNKALADQLDYVGAFIVKLVEADRSEEAEIVLKDVLDLQIPVSVEAAQMIKEKFQLQNELNVETDLLFQQLNNGNGKRMPNVSEMDVKSLECHKQELESKGMNARGTSRKLFLKYCASENLDKVLQCKNDFENESGPISRGMKSALMGAYIRNEVLEPALELFQELTNNETVSDVVVDVYKIIDLATLMIKKGMTEEGITIILEKCPTRRIHRPESISRNIVSLLEAVSKSNANYVNDLTELFLKLRFIKPTNPTLGPSIRHLITRNDLEAAVERFEDYAKKYGVTPCLQELTYAVLKKPQLLERVISSSSSVKGEREAKRLLALARADVGDIDGAARGLMELGKELSFVSLINQVEYLSSRNEINRVLNLIRAIHKTGLNFDCMKLYEIAIQACKRFDNENGLKELHYSMQEQDLYLDHLK